MKSVPTSRADTLERLRSGPMDLLVIGGGITGARIALEGARAGWRVALVDGGDFGGGTSSASSKLVHGGFRYLPMGDIRLVRESQHERRLLMASVAPNLVRPIPFVLPVYEGSPRGAGTVAAGLMLYRALAGHGGRAAILNRGAARQVVPPLRTERLRMCGMFEEAETIDSRLVLATVKGAARFGALVLNHAKVIDLQLRNSRGAIVTLDAGDDGLIDVRSKHVINAAGPWVDHVRFLDDATTAPLVRLSKGVHILLPLDGDWNAGVAVPLEGGRVTLAIPWQGMLMLGTTDTLFTGNPSEVHVTPADVQEIFDDAAGFLPRDMLHPDRVRFSIAGLRALPITDGDTAAARREHLIEVSCNGLVSVAGGKLTTHRLIALDALRRLPESAFDGVSPDIRRLPGTGWSQPLEAATRLAPDVADHLERLYGDEAGLLLELAAATPDGLERMHPSGPDVWAQADYAFEAEWAATVEDVARRRTTLAVRGLMTEEIADRIRSRMSKRPTRSRMEVVRI